MTFSEKKEDQKGNSPGFEASFSNEGPLQGSRVLVTRPRRQAASLCKQLSDLGAGVLLQAAIEITDPPDWGDVDAALDRLTSYDWLVFSSTNGVRFFLDRLKKREGTLEKLHSVRLAAIGSGTAEELARYEQKADCTPQQYRAESLAEALAAKVESRRCLLIRASRGREVLADMLREAGGLVDQVVAYSSSDVVRPDDSIDKMLGAGQIDWITVTSSAIAKSLHRMWREKLEKSKLASISPITTATLRQLGHEPATEARHYTMAGIVQAMVDSESKASG